MIIPLFDDLPLIEKTKVLMNFFPVKLFSMDELIISLINRDPNLISKYTKRLAIAEYKNFFNEIKSDLIAQLFSPISDLQLLSAKAIQELVPEKLDDLIKRIEPDEQRKLKLNLKNSLSAYSQNVPESKLYHAFFKETNPKNISLVELSEYLNINEFNKNEISGDHTDFINYFVFLVIYNTELNDNDQKLTYQLYFEGLDNKTHDWKSILEDQHIIIGIEKTRMSKLFLKYEEFVQNLIIIS